MLRKAWLVSAQFHPGRSRSSSWTIPSKEIIRRLCRSLRQQQRPWPPPFQRSNPLGASQCSPNEFHILLTSFEFVFIAEVTTLRWFKVPTGRHPSRAPSASECQVLSNSRAEEKDKFPQQLPSRPLVRAPAQLLTGRLRPRPSRPNSLSHLNKRSRCAIRAYRSLPM